MYIYALIYALYLVTYVCMQSQMNNILSKRELFLHLGVRVLQFIRIDKYYSTLARRYMIWQSIIDVKLFANTANYKLSKRWRPHMWGTRHTQQAA